METTSAGVSVRLAPDVPSLEALGASSAEDFFADPPRIETGARCTRSGESWRVPLPGTPDERGVQHERPRGAGTGFLRLQRWRGGGLELARVRLTAPRSSSLAARWWNLSCHLQAHGLVSPPLVAMGERDGAFAARESFVIVRELEGFVPLARWLAETRDADERRRGFQALGLALGALFRCGAWLPRTTPEGIHVQRGDGEDCAALQIVNLQSEQSLLRERGLQRARLPAIAFTELDRGRILSHIDGGRRARFVRGLTSTLDADEQRLLASLTR